jgi:hypothetical protein
MTQSKRARIPDHGDLLSASRLSSGQFEQTLARSIRILDICNFVEDPSMHHSIWLSQNDTLTCM